GLRLGSTENAVVCTELLQDLLARGLTLDGRVLCVIDGGKGLRKALGDVLGCQGSPNFPHFGSSKIPHPPG
ncbi:MAG TPA: hypothetical protein VK132_09795, partial [Gemmatimonadales bacterium]|nr:hypothetical protein [Gemmatimonadales bacterium]